MRKKESKIKRYISNVLIVLAGICLAVGAYFSIRGLITDIKDYNEVEADREELTDTFHKTVPQPNAQGGDLDLPYDESEDLKLKYDTMKAINPDYACWLKINGTGQEYPVCVNLEGSSYYYLNHSFKRKPLGAGCLFIDPGSSVDCDNLIIYGHHMRNGTMFGSLGKFLKEEWTRDGNNSLIEVFTETEHRYYEVVCVLTASVYKMPFSITGYTDLSDYNDNVAFGNLLRKHSQINMDWKIGDNGFEPNPNLFTPGVYKDRFLTLITCEYTHRNGREVVIARELYRPMWTAEEMMQSAAQSEAISE